MYEPSHFKVENRAALRGLMHAYPLATLESGQKPGVLNGFDIDPESGSQAMTALIKTCAFGSRA